MLLQSFVRSDVIQAQISFCGMLIGISEAAF